MAAECPVCLEPLLLPCRLHCGHEVDAHCLLRMLARVEDDDICSKCPCCRVAFKASDIDVSRVHRALSGDTLAPHQRDELQTAVRETEESRQSKLERRNSGELRSGRRQVHPNCLLTIFIAVTVVILVFSLKEHRPGDRKAKKTPGEKRLPPQSYVECLILLSREEVEFNAEAQPLFRSCGKIWASTTRVGTLQNWLVGRSGDVALVNDSAVAEEPTAAPTTSTILPTPIVHALQHHPRLRHRPLAPAEETTQQRPNNNNNNNDKRTKQHKKRRS